MPTPSAYHLENLLNDYLGCGECKLLKSKIQVFLHQTFFRRKAIIISTVYGSLCFNSYVPNTFILGDSHVTENALRKSVTSSYKVNKEFRFKVFCTVFMLCVCVCVLSCISSEEGDRKSHPYVCLGVFLFTHFPPAYYAYMEHT